MTLTRLRSRIEALWEKRAHLREKNGLTHGEGPLLVD